MSDRVYVERKLYFGNTLASGQYGTRGCQLKPIRGFQALMRGHIYKCLSEQQNTHTRAHTHF